MSIISYSQTMRSFGSISENIIDFGQTPSNWTPGSTQIDSVQFSGIPPLAKWNVIATAVSAQLLWNQQGAGASFGRFGKVIAGLVPTGQVTTGAAGAPSTAKMLPLPEDTSYLQTLWDGSSDPSPPVATSLVTTTAPFPLQESLQLPQPIVISSSTSLAFGLWVTPSLTQNATLVVYRAVFTVYFDDGKPVPPTL
jgi:hypothetical protein